MGWCYMTRFLVYLNSVAQKLKGCFNYWILGKGSVSDIVIHPMFDKPEKKIDVDSLGLMTLSWKNKLILNILRVYLIIMLILALYKIYAVSKN